MLLRVKTESDEKPYAFALQEYRILSGRNPADCPESRIPYLAQGDYLRRAQPASTRRFGPDFERSSRTFRQPFPAGWGGAFSTSWHGPPLPAVAAGAPGAVFTSPATITLVLLSLLRLETSALLPCWDLLFVAGELLPRGSAAWARPAAEESMRFTEDVTRMAQNLRCGS
jgi:hypothetical protein